MTHGHVNVQMRF